MPIPFRSFVIAAALLAPLASQQPTPSATPRIAVRVLDDRGRPARGVPITLGVLGTIGDRADFDAVGTVARTGDDGIALLDDPGRPVLHAQAQVLVEPTLRALVQRRKDGAPAADLKLPPTGQVRVIVYDEHEQPRAGVSAVQLSVAGTRNIFDATIGVGDAQREGAMFAHVGLGLAVHARAQLADVHGALEADRPGPVRAGELVVIDLREQAAPQLRCRLVDAAGAPVGNARLSVAWRAGTRLSVENATTAADGTLRMQVQPPFALADVRVWLLASEPTSSLGATLVLPPTWRGVRDFGDLPFVAEPVVARGRIVDRDGKPVQGLAITLPRTNDAGCNAVTIQARSFERRVVTDADGRFEVRELEPQAEQLQLGAPRGAFGPAPRHARTDGDWWLPRDAVLPFGDAETVVHAERGGSLRIELPGLPAGLAIDCVRVAADGDQWRGPGNLNVNDPTEVTSVQDGLEFARLQPDTYQVAVGISGLGDAARRIEGLAVRDGERCADARLRFDDWQQWLALVSLRVVDERGAPVAAHVMDYAVQGSNYSGRGRATAVDGTLRVLAPRGHQWVVSTPQSRAIVLVDPRGDVEVRLQARADVTLRAPDGVDIPAGLHLHLRSREHSFVHGSELDLATAGERQWRIRPVLGGRMRVTLCAPSADGTEVEAWRGELTIGADANAPIDLPIDARTAAALPRPTAGK